MFAKFIHRREPNENAVLGDIIPSSESIENEKTKASQCGRICTIVSCIFMLGLIAIGIVLLVFIFVYSHNALMNFFVQPLTTNRTQFAPNDPHLQLNISLNQSQWKRITVLPEEQSSTSTVRPTTTTKQRRRKFSSSRHFNDNVDDVLDDLFFS